MSYYPLSYYYPYYPRYSALDRYYPYPYYPSVLPSLAVESELRRSRIEADIAASRLRRSRVEAEVAVESALRRSRV
jgi:hypothetical protein